MGNYNPEAPHILGEEWVPIRNVYTVFNPFIDSVEYGHTFTLPTARTIAQGRFYVGDIPGGVNSSTVYKTTIYAQGTEDQTGPIRSVVIPVETVTATGGAVLAAPAGWTGPQALLSPSGDGRYDFNGAVAYSVIWTRFNTGAYSALLTDKRILGVNVLIAGTIDWIPGPDFGPPLIGIQSAASVGASGALFDLFPINTDDPFGSATFRYRLGEYPTFSATSLSTPEFFLPWTYPDLQLMDGGAGTVFVSVGIGQSYNSAPLTGNMEIRYMALEVLYCEERRVAMATWTAGDQLVWGTNPAQMRAWPAKTVNPTLSAGDYTVTLAIADPGDKFVDVTGNTLGINSTRELYPIEGIEGVQIDIPWPPEDNIGATITKQYSAVLPQITLNTSGAVITEVHAYGRQIAAQVHGSLVADQLLYDNFPITDEYPYIRFYARRFGDLSTPLTVTGINSTTGVAMLSVEDFDALNEIVDGWKEITLELSPVPTLGNNSTPEYRFSSTGAPPGGRWEVLGAAAPALTGTPANLLNLATQQLGTATYQPPTGTTQQATWMPNGVTGPYVSSSTADPATDLVVIMSTMPPTITGFSGSTEVQDLTGIGLDCGIEPCGIPTGVEYVHLEWPVPDPSFALDTFDRTESSGWGTANSGEVWSVVEGGAANFSVADGVGVHSQVSVNAFRTTQLTIGAGNDFDLLVSVKNETTPTGAGMVMRLCGRRGASPGDFYAAELEFTTTSTINFRLLRSVAFAETTIAGSMVLAVPNAMDWYRIRLQIIGTTISGKAWRVGDPEPEFQLTAVDANLTTGSIAQVQSRLTTSNTNTLPVLLVWDDFISLSSALGTDFTYELQRMDDLTDWETIMVATDVATQSFNDYEARVGISTQYRVRVVNEYNFPGPWSGTVTATIDAPGVTGECLDNHNHVLIFTSNESQEGTYNLAYSSAWEGTVSEEFQFPEAGFTQLQAMYSRDFFTAFRPLERGGERFSRDILVQAAAIDPETLADFTGLRDMAWTDLPYVCVRDEDGNRWFATVLVPNGKVSLNRTIYIASVEIIEVTDTPSPVDP